MPKHIDVMRHRDGTETVVEYDKAHAHAIVQETHGTSWTGVLIWTCIKCGSKTEVEVQRLPRMLCMTVLCGSCKTYNKVRHDVDLQREREMEDALDAKWDDRGDEQEAEDESI